MKKNSSTLSIIFSYIILSSTALIAIDLFNNNAYATNQTKNILSNTTGTTTDNTSSLLKLGNTARQYSGFKCKNVTTYLFE